MKNVYVVCVTLLLCAGCIPRGNATPQSASGVSQASVRVTTGSDGLTVEQRNISRRVALENKPGSVKHLYIISAYSGQVLLYSTVDGKVTSSGKRLTPTSVTMSRSLPGDLGPSSVLTGIPVAIGNRWCETGEVLQDDGTYGSSIDYLYWFDSKGIYHQHYVQGGQIVHVSDQPIAVKEIVLNLELGAEK